MSYGHFGNYSDRAPARFVPAAEQARLVTPSRAFQPDSGGGHGIPSVSGDRHDQVAKEAPAWFRASVEALAMAEAGVAVLAQKIGGAGNYRFWSAPSECQSQQQWEKATATAIADRAVVRAAADAAQAAAAAEWAATFPAAHEVFAAKKGWVIVDHIAATDRNPGAHVSVAMDDAGDVYHLRSVNNMTGRGYNVQVQKP